MQIITGLKRLLWSFLTWFLITVSANIAGKWLWRHIFFFYFLFFPFYTSIEKISESSLRIQSSEKITSISLPVAPAYHVIEFELEVMYLPSATESAVEKGNTINKENHRKNKEKQKQDNCMATVDQKVRCSLTSLLLNVFDCRGKHFTK